MRYWCMTKQFFAHTIEGQTCEAWQPLEDHLNHAANLAQSFADSFNSGNWAYCAGIWHDIGKYSDAFQNRLRSLNDPESHIETQQGRPDHSTAGAQHAFQSLKDKGKILAYIIAGHHAGLPNGKSNDRSCLIERLNKAIPDYSDCPEFILSNTLHQSNLPFQPDMRRCGFQISFFIRMLYSCLVDADFLDTELFMNKEQSNHRKGYPSLFDLYVNLKNALTTLLNNASKRTINTYRAEILQNCIDAANQAQGLFSLTVPTGGGKTLSSLAFAMHHAIKHHLKRIIYVIPYTSIIEQNAAVFKSIFGENAVLEHHSNFEPKKEDHRSRLAAENWDAPLIVTTNVQFFESFFNNRSSKCRKIHHIAKSVVILDEAQMLPIENLLPCLEVLKELVSTYQSTIVLCTATQPALSKKDLFQNGLDPIHEIIPDPQKLYHVFKRVHTKHLGTLSDAKLAHLLSTYSQALCIVNTRKHARKLFDSMLDTEHLYHLSALMCPEHRTQVIQIIKNRLKNNQPCRVISTQLIEAGVDIDFPIVFRAAAGIDSIAQAAGRCNREGKLAEGGQVFVFMPENGLPANNFKQHADIAEMVMRKNHDILSLQSVLEYFKSLYWIKGKDQLDQYNILHALEEDVQRGNFPFKDISDQFYVIKQTMESLIIPWNAKGQKLVDHLRYSNFPSSICRKLQRFIIQIYPKDFNLLVSAGCIETIHDQYHVLLNMDLYKDTLGLCPENPTYHNSETLIV